MRRILALTALLAVALAACSDQPTDAQDRGPLLPEDRLALPTFDLARYRALLAELEGTPVVVNIWGSWCPPCQVEAADLSKVAREYQGRAQFVGVDILDNREPARDFILEFDWPYPSVFDPPGAIRDGLGYLGQPVTIVYDRAGEVVFEWEGAVTAELLRTEIDKVV